MLHAWHILHERIVLFGLLINNYSNIYFNAEHYGSENHNNPYFAVFRASADLPKLID